MGKPAERFKPYKTGNEGSKKTRLAVLKRVETKTLPETTKTLPTMRLTEPMNETFGSKADRQREDQAQRMLWIAIECLKVWDVPKAAWTRETQSFLSGLDSVWREKVGNYSKDTELAVLEALKEIHLNGITGWFACRPSSVEVGEVAIPVSDL